MRCKMLVKMSKTPPSTGQGEQSTWKRERDSSPLLSLEGAGNHSSLPCVTQGTQQRPGGSHLSVVSKRDFFSSANPDFQGKLLQLQHCGKT